MLSIEIDTKPVATFLDAAPRKTGLAALRALKRGTKSTGTHAGRVAAKDTGLKVSAAKKRIRVIEPTGQTLEGQVRASLKRIPLIEFPRAKSRLKRIPGAFAATMPTGHEGVFKRAGRSRLPIQQLFGPSVGRVVDAHREEIMARADRVTTAELNRLLNQILESN